MFVEQDGQLCVLGVLLNHRGMEIFFNKINPLCSSKAGKKIQEILFNVLFFKRKA